MGFEITTDWIDRPRSTALESLRGLLAGPETAPDRPLYSHMEPMEPALLAERRMDALTERRWVREGDLEAARRDGWRVIGSLGCSCPHSEEHCRCQR